MSAAIIWIIPLLFNTSYMVIVEHLVLSWNEISIVNQQISNCSLTFLAKIKKEKIVSKSSIRVCTKRRRNDTYHVERGMENTQREQSPTATATVTVDVEEKLASRLLLGKVTIEGKTPSRLAVWHWVIRGNEWPLYKNSKIQEVLSSLASSVLDSDSLDSTKSEATASEPSSDAGLLFDPALKTLCSDVLRWKRVIRSIINTMVTVNALLRFGLNGANGRGQQRATYLENEMMWNWWV